MADESTNKTAASDTHNPEGHHKPEAQARGPAANTSSIPTDNPTRFRSAMPIAQQVAYFDHAAVAPLPAPTRNAIHNWLDQATNEGDVAWAQWSQRMEQVR